MKKVLLIHQYKIQHYRLFIYNYLNNYISNNYNLSVVSGGIENSNNLKIDFNYIESKMDFVNLFKIINRECPDVIILFVNIKNKYLFPVIIYAHYNNIKIIYWGHGINLENKKSIKNILYSLEHKMCDALILYSRLLIKFINPKYKYKIFIANNTLNTTDYKDLVVDKGAILSRYGVKTSKNIICVGRMQRRKRIQDLVEAFKRFADNDVGLILIGPDSEGVLDSVCGENIYKLGPIYGDEVLGLLASADVFCLPGHVGLGIVDAFYFGLPLVTEDVDHAPEIEYLKDGVNGFMVPKGDIDALHDKLKLLIDDDDLRHKFALEAKLEVQRNANIDIMSKGFKDALDFVLKND